MKKINTIVLCLLGLSISAIVFFACSKEVTPELNQMTDYKSIKIGEFSAGEIGAYHNIALSLLKDETMATSSPNKITQILTDELPKINNRFTSSTIDLAFSSFRKNNLSIIKSGTLKSASVSDFLLEGLNFLISKNIISDNVKIEILKLSEMDLVSMQLYTNKLVNSKEWTNKEKEFFAVYTSTYENSIIYWTKAKKLKSTSGYVYAADAAGAIIGLGAGMIAGPIGGSIWSIVQGAIASWMVDNPDQPSYEFELGSWY